MQYKRVLLGVVVASALALASVVSWAVVAPSRAAPPDAGGITVPYAGRLNDAQGEPVADGTYDFSFGLYADETGGKALWQETQPGVPVAGGAFSVQLGSTAAIPEGALGGEGAWLAVAVRGPGEVEFTGLAPRQHLSASAAADSEVDAAAAPACPHTHFGEVWSGGTGRGLWVGTTTIQSALIGVNVPTSNSGALGQYNSGVFAVARCTDCDGVEAFSSGGHGVEGTTSGNWSNRSGVYGEAIHDQANGVTGWNSAAGPGVYGYSERGVGLIARGADGGNFAARKGDLELRGSYGDILAPGFLRLWSDLDVYVTVDVNNDGSNSFTIFNGNGQSVFSVNEAGNTWARGSKGALVEAGSYGDRELYAVESPEVWFEDFGTAQLLNGRAAVPIEPVFAETVALDRDYHVFLTPLGDCQGLYVAAKHPAAFEVRELSGGATSLAFDYRIVARRRGFENVRLETVEPGARPVAPVEGEP